MYIYIYVYLSTIRYSGRRKIFTVGGSMGGDEKQSTSLSQKSSSSDQHSSATEGQPVSMSMMNETGQPSEPASAPTLHNFLSDPPTPPGRNSTGEAFVASPLSGVFYKRKHTAKSSMEVSRAVKKGGVFEIKVS